MFENSRPMKHNDLPITTIDEDKLKFGPFVNRVVAGIKGYTQDECFVISIEGEWGIGKTSFMNLVNNQLKDDAEILRFNPWLVSNIEQLVSVFFGELIKSISHISFSTKLKTDITKDMKALLSVIVPDQVSVGVTDGSKATWKLGKYFKPKDPHAAQTLYEQKEKINEYLRDAEKRIVVVIDDIDRLMDNEVELLFRLIKGIADFDNVTYILLFDRKIISNSLEKYKAENGSRYLDKIIQYPLTIPKSHHSTILKLLTDKLDALLVSLGKENYHFAEEAWQHVYQELSKYIKNIRDVNKVFDAFSFEYMSISKDVNFVDFFVITLIRLHSHELYSVIKNKPELFNYDLAYTTLGMYGSDDSSARQKEIIKRIKKEYPELDKDMDLLQTVFPVFSTYGPKSITGNHKRKSIGDKFYFDNYFSMTVSADKLSSDKYYHYFKILVEDVDAFTKIIQELDPAKLQQFFEMFRESSSDAMTDEVRKNVIQNIITSFLSINERDFRNDESFADFTWFSLSWMDLAAEEILKLENPEEMFSILDDKNIEIQHRCHLRYRIKDAYKKIDSNKLNNKLQEYKERHINEIANITIDTLLKFEFLDKLLFCSGWLEMDMTALSNDFKQQFLKDKDSFFAILEKFIYKHVSMPRLEYPYSIQKTALMKLVAIDKVQEFIDALDKDMLNKTEQKLLKYWANDPDF